MNQQVPLKEIVTVTEMARMCRLSRARFYQLVNESVFPTPSRNRQTGRPFFNREQQEQCLTVRRTNRGVNGKAVMSYGCRPLGAPKLPAKRKQLPISKSSKDNARQNPVITELRHGLKQLGVDTIHDRQIRAALNQAYPDGYKGIPTSDLLGSVFVTLQQLKEAG